MGSICTPDKKSILVVKLDHIKTVPDEYQQKGKSVSSDLSLITPSDVDKVICINSLRIAFDANPALKKLMKDQAENLIAGMDLASYEQGETIIEKGQRRANELIVVLKGSLVFRDSREEVGSILGDDAIVDDLNYSTYQEDVVVAIPVLLARINRDDFERAIGGTYESVSSLNEILSVLKKVQLLRGLSPARLVALSKAIDVQRFEPKDMIVKQHSEGSCFYIIRNGAAEVWRDRIKIRSITKFDYFGERSVLFNDFRSASVVATSTVEVWVITKRVFNETINESIQRQLLDRIQLQDSNVTMEELVSVSLIGKGSFGVVQLVCHRDHRNLYALKAVNRQLIEICQIQEHLRNERSILMEIDHVLIMKLVKTFKDTERLYFLMEYVRGEVLYEAMRKIGILAEDESKFYIACLLVTLIYLHERNIIYRDLKPENVIIDEQGYTKLIDFGIAKVVHGRTYTVLGTPHYMAPEVFTRNGYNYAADYWSLGVILYEFLCGIVPFGDGETEPYSVYRCILKGELTYPSFINKTSLVIRLIEQLLTTNPAVRVGVLPEQLMKHPWFQGVDWDLLISRQLSPPYIPVNRNFSNEVQEAIRLDRSPQDFFAREESELQREHRTRRSKKAYAHDWDAEFCCYT